jgi:CRISPR-associated protein Cmr4
MKGALRDYTGGFNPVNVDRWFGKQDNAGDVLISDGRLLLLPVRSLTGAYRWLTCPHLIERLRRDRERIGLPATGLTVPIIPSTTVLTHGQQDALLFLEERSFKISGQVPDALVTALGGLIADDSARARLAGQIALVSDDDFNWFARYALSVQARNSLDENKISTNLWYEETLPPDSLFYTMLVSRGIKSLEAIAGLGNLLSDHPYIQIGGNETVGQGWFRITLCGKVE